MLKNIGIFVLGVAVCSAIFFLLPIEMFDGEVVIENGQTDIVQEQKLSLSYFIGIGIDEEDLKGINSFYLTGMGYFFAFLMLIGLPLLLTIRLALRPPNET